MNKKGFTVIEILTSFSIALTILIVLFNVVIIMKDNLSSMNAKTNLLVQKDNLSYNINKRFKEKELSSVTMCDEGDKCYEFTYSDDTSDRLVYSNTDKSITFNNYTFDIIDGITVEEPTITEHYDTMSSTTYNGYFIINIPIKLDNKDYSIKINKHFNTDSLVIDFTKYIYDANGNKYSPVEYLESTGTQYIDTNINYSNNIKMELNVQSITNLADLCGLYKQGYWTIGIRVRKNVYEGTWMYNSNGTGANAIEALTSNVNYSNKSSIVLDNTGMQINGSKISTTKNKDFGIIDSGIIIGNVKEIDSGNLISNSTDVKFFTFKLYDNNTLVRDYIPVIDSSSRPCLFDKVEKKCYYNQGTGEFLYG